MSSATARRIEKAGLTLMAERGYENVTVHDIAETAGVSVRTLFRCFPSKAAIFTAEAERTLERITQALDEQPPEVTAFDALCEVLLARVRQASPEDLSNMRRWNEAAIRSGDSARYELLGVRLGYMATQISERIAHRLPDRNDTMFGMVLVGAVIHAAGLGFLYWTMEGGEHPEPYVRRALESIGALRATAAGRR
ncbi:MAG: TetR/AcrR family transcriptional regulator [Phenylobacterium sp.]